MLAAARAVIAEKGFRGPVETFLFVNLRLLNYQTLENAAGVGAPPWAIDEQVIALLYKAIYAFVTGATAVRLIAQDRPTGRSGNPVTGTPVAGPGCAEAALLSRFPRRRGGACSRAPARAGPV